MQTMRYNGYPTMRIAGDAAPGYSTGEAMAEMERLAGQLPPGFAYEWTGQSREEKLAGAQALYLFGFSLLAVFLCLAALYESWSIPFAVILVVPLGVLGVVLGADAARHANDVYFKVGLITIIGLSAKNAILIIEFAKDLQAQGTSAIEATLEAAHLRFRPIVMTSIAFILGVLPLAHRQRRRLGQPARDRHRRDGRHDHRDGAGGVLRAGVLRRRAPLLQGQRAAAQAVRARTRSAASRKRRRQTEEGTAMNARMDLAPRRVCMAGLALLAGCASMAPTYERPAAPVAAGFPGEAAAGKPAAGAAAADIDWQQFFVDRAAQAPDRARAAEQPRPARRRAQRRAGARAVPDPARRAVARPCSSAPPARPGPTPAATASIASTPPGLTITGYELDLFGRVRSLSDAALAAVPGQRRGAQDGADQPGRRGCQRATWRCWPTTSSSTLTRKTLDTRERIATSCRS